MRLLVTLTCLIWSTAQLTGLAQVMSEDARRLRLELAWQSQVQLPLTSGLASAQLWTEETNPRKFAVVELPGHTIRIAADKLDRSGNPIGIELAKKQALQEAQFISWDKNGDGQVSPAEATNLGRAFSEIDRDRDGFISYAENSRFIDWTRLISTTLGAADAARMMRERQLQDVASMLSEPTGFEVIEQVIPRVKLVLVSRSGSVATLDAETGNLLWATICGDSGAPAFPAGLSKAGITIIQGERLYVLDWETGKQLEDKHLQYATSNAVAVTNTMAFVADFSGRVEAYGIGDTNFIQRWGYVIRGRAIGDTVSLLDRNLCAMASNDSLVYVFNATDTPSVWMRYQSSTPIVRCLGVGNGAFYAGNLGGKLSKIVVDDRLGRIQWEYLGGQSFSTPPLIVGSNVFVASDTGALYCVNDAEGVEAWASDSLGVTQPLAVANNVVYARTMINEVIGFDIGTGRVLGRSLPRALGHAVTNQISDRVYLIGKHGQVQCLRPMGSVAPVMVTPPKLPEAGATEIEPATTPAEGGEMAPGSSPFETPPAGGNPFGSGSDPFGAAPAAAGAAPAAAGGATANPFGADPFGAGNN